MKICIDERTYEGSATEIMDQLRQQTFDPTEYPDTESYIYQLRSNFMRTTDLDSEENQDLIYRADRYMETLVHTKEKARQLCAMADEMKEV